jgi:SAM-dependent methyltransferase
MEALFKQVDADYRSKLLDVLPHEPTARLLDVGCDDGGWTAQLAERIGIPPAQVSGIEIVDEQRQAAIARGFDARDGDLEASWPFAESSFEIVHANQVIEHVKRLDHFMSEATRVLAPGGLLLVCTENLASWHNVVSLMLGYQPFSITNISQTGTIGNPFALHDESSWESWQHIHVMTLEALRDLFRRFGLRDARVFASGYYPAWGNLASRLADHDPRHAHFIGLIGRLDSVSDG